MTATDPGDFRQRILEWARAEGLDKLRPRKARTKRKHLSHSDKLAAVLLLLANDDGSPLIPAAARNSKATILATPIQWDHVIALGLEGPDTFDNQRPRSVADHKRKTKVDKGRMAHNDRLRKAREEAEVASAVRRLLAPTPTADVIPFPKRSSKRIAKAGKHYRPMPGSKDSKWKRTMRHGTVLREKRP